MPLLSNLKEIQLQSFINQDSVICGNYRTRTLKLDIPINLMLLGSDILKRCNLYNVQEEEGLGKSYSMQAPFVPSRYWYRSRLRHRVSLDDFYNLSLHQNTANSVATKVILLILIPPSLTLVLERLSHYGSTPFVLL